jgi:hypothetical protein
MCYDIRRREKAAGVGMEVRFARPVADLLCAEKKSRLAVATWLSHPGRRSYHPQTDESDIMTQMPLRMSSTSPSDSESCAHGDVMVVHGVRCDCD